MVNLTQNQGNELTNKLAELKRQAKEYINEAKSESTKRSYAHSINHFMAWCEAYGLCPLPATPETLMLYITDISKDIAPSTIDKRMAAISQAHQAKGYDVPNYDYRVRNLLSGIKKKTGYEPKSKKAISLDNIKAMVDLIDDKTLQGLRDKLIILLGFALATRRGELAEVKIEDIEWKDKGIVVKVYESKKNRFIKKAVPRIGGKYCPVSTLENWLIETGIKSGYLLRSFFKGGSIRNKKMSDNTVYKTIKKYIAMIGLNPDAYGSHSLRSGLATSGSEHNYNFQSIMKQTGHKNVKMVQRYTQEGQYFENNPASILGLIEED